MSSDLAQHVLDLIRAAGVRTVCVCPGARNAEWVRLLAEPNPGFEVFWHFEERSAAYFALGRARSEAQPAAIVTTSGTAAGELLPAAMEAYYSGIPIFLLTADRPRRFRGSGAPQAAEQAGIFGIYTPTAYDLEDPERLESPIRAALSPIHVNVCFEDPNSEPPPVFSGSVPENASPSRRAERDGKGGLRGECIVTTPQPSSGFLPENASQSRRVERDEKGRSRGEGSVTATKPALGSEPENVSRSRYENSPAREFASAIQQIQRPVVIVGALQPSENSAVEEFLARLGAPVYLESLSGLRPSPKLDTLKIKVGDQLLRRARESGYTLDGVIRIGDVPTHRFWRDLEDLGVNLKVVSLSRLGFSGLGRESTLVHANVTEVLQAFEPAAVPAGEPAALLKHDRAAYHCLVDSLNTEPAAEPTLFRVLSQAIPAGSMVYLGNSLPIREWDLAGDWSDRRIDTFASRGLNGIDGQLSTFLGLCQPSRCNWGILGDLTTLYDLAGPWPLAQMAPEINANLVVVNNSGGKIFDRMFGTPQFQNSHSLSFERWAAMWGLSYEFVGSSARQLRAAAAKPTRGLRVIELHPDPTATQRFWTTYTEALI